MGMKCQICGKKTVADMPICPECIKSADDSGNSEALKEAAEIISIAESENVKATIKNIMKVAARRRIVRI